MEENLQVLEQKALTFPELVKGIVVEDDVSLLKAEEALIYIKSTRKEIDEAFDPIIKRANEAHKVAIAQKRKIEKPLVEAKNIIDPQISGYLHRKEEERRKLEEAEKRKLTAEKAFGMVEPDTKIVAHKEKPPLKSTHMRKHWTWKVVDRDKIPIEYLTVDELKIGECVRTLKGKTKIPGILVYQKDIVATRL